MIELKTTDIKFIYKHFILCKDFKSLKIDNTKKRVYLDKKDYETLKTFKRLKKGY